MLQFAFFMMTSTKLNPISIICWLSGAYLNQERQLNEPFNRGVAPATQIISVERVYLLHILKSITRKKRLFCLDSLHWEHELFLECTYSDDSTSKCDGHLILWVLSYNSLGVRISFNFKWFLERNLAFPGLSMPVVFQDIHANILKSSICCNLDRVMIWSGSVWNSL